MMESELLYKKSLKRHIWRVSPYGWSRHYSEPNVFVYYEESKRLDLSRSLSRQGHKPSISEVRLFVKVIFEAKEISRERS